jgi:putative ABC transport system permease protein
MGLGLVVGVAAIGVIAFRSVVERRQQIGVLRALGFQRSLVSLGFMIETGFIVGVGALSGTVLGILLSRNLLTGDSAGSPVENFSVPWLTILIILGATIASALGMTWLPSRQAGRIAPAEALRYE